MSGTEIFALVPVAYGILHLGKKVFHLRNTVDAQNERIGELEGALSSISNGLEDRKSDNKGPSVIATTVMVSSVATASMLLVYNATMIWQRRRYRVGRGVPLNYTPQLATVETEQCLICLENKKDTMISPCNHLCMCWNCAFELNSRAESRRMGCPVCRGTIEDLHFAFM